MPPPLAGGGDDANAFDGATAVYPVRQGDERLRSDDGWLSFEVQDDGGGFELDHASGSGIQGMGDRLDAIGGSLEIDSAPGTGTVVRGRIPAAPLAAQE